MNRIKAYFRQDTSFMSFLISVLAMGLGYGLYKGVIDNYLAEFVQMDALGKGINEFFRELPGLMLIAILAVFYTFSAEKMYKIGAALMLLGMGLVAVVPPSFVLITFAIFVHSLGDHIQLGMKNTLCLKYSTPGKGGRALGIMSSAGQIGTLIGYVAVIGCFMIITENQPYRLFFVLAAFVIMLGFICTLRIRGDSVTDSSKRRFYFRKKFTKYYMLEIFYGARKQVFFTFGPFVLILFYNAGAGVISLLFAISAVLCSLLSPMVGKIIDRLGYKVVMVSDTLILVVVCFFYGFAHKLFSMETAFIVCCANYVLDSIISLASMASNVYVQDISDSDEEMRATISTGISVNHAISILIALFGGWIWKALGIETLFIISAVLGLCNSAYAATIKGKKA